MKIPQIIQLNEFLPYFFVGLIATFIDWTTFWISTTHFALHYELALVISYTTAGAFHYTANKFITFKCPSKKIGSQFSLYFIVTGASLLMSMGVIALIKFFIMNTLFARILTTALMLIPNFLLHKHITFSKKIFSTSSISHS
jgi:putative flippase GtrA